MILCDSSKKTKNNEMLIQEYYFKIKIEYLFILKPNN